jgi:hypothetical protein
MRLASENTELEWPDAVGSQQARAARLAAGTMLLRAETLPAQPQDD